MNGRILLGIVLLTLVVLLVWYTIPSAHIGRVHSAPTVYYDDDPAFDYKWAKAPGQALYGIVGTDTWKFGPNGEDLTLGITPCVYLCHAGSGLMDAIRALDIPKLGTTNQSIVEVSCPLFVNGGDWFCATLHNKTGDRYAVAWNVATRRPFMLGKLDHRYRPINRVAKAYLADYDLAVKNNCSTTTADQQTIAITGVKTWKRELAPR